MNAPGGITGGVRQVQPVVALDLRGGSDERWRGSRQRSGARGDDRPEVHRRPRVGLFCGAANRNVCAYCENALRDRGASVRGEQVPRLPCRPWVVGSPSWGREGSDESDG
jgi:hypothetical protein